MFLLSLTTDWILDQFPSVKPVSDDRFTPSAAETLVCHASSKGLMTNSEVRSYFKWSVQEQEVVKLHQIIQWNRAFSHPCVCQQIILTTFELITTRCPRPPGHTTQDKVTGYFHSVRQLLHLLD